MSVEAAFEHVVRACAGHIAANLRCAYQGREPEGVHQLRVGIRRLRAAVSVFRDVVPKADVMRLRRELRWLQGELGPAREWDVFVEHVAAGEHRAVNRDSDSDALRASARRERAKAYGRVRRALRSGRCARILASLVIEPQWGGHAGADGAQLQQPIREFAGATLRQRHKRVRKLGKRLGKLGTAELHALRIRVKRLRYAVEFFAELWPGKLTERYVARLEVLQDLTGQAEDAVVALDQLDRLRGARPSKHPVRVGHLRRRTRRRLRKLRKKLRMPWRHFAKLRPFWSRGRHSISRRRSSSPTTGSRKARAPHPGAAERAIARSTGGARRPARQLASDLHGAPVARKLM
jgi:CHAD domain-containing protein